MHPSTVATEDLHALLEGSVKNAARSRWILVGVLAASGALAPACQCERLFAEEVGDGAARLTIQNAGNLLALIDADANCGFQSPDVLGSYVVDGEVDTEGTVTWSVQECALDFGEVPVEVATDCNGVVTAITGKAVVSATRTVAGKITGDVGTPVIPLSSDAVTMTLSAIVNDYRVVGTDELRIKSGAIEIIARPHLARSASLGVCAVPTPAVTLEAVRVRNAQYEISSDGRRFIVPVPQADLNAQVGSYGDVENHIGGRITVWDADIDLAHNDRLDPSYDQSSFADSFACRADLKLPLDYTCLAPEPAIAAGAARLLVVNAANLLAIVENDATCGFASPAALRAVVVQGTPGGVGQATWTIADCLIHLGNVPVVIDTDCNGAQTLASGSLSVGGTRTLQGRVTGDAATPIIPLTPDAAHLDVQALVVDYQVHRSSSSGGDAPSLRMESGTLGVRATVHLAQSASLGVCSIATNDVTLDSVVVTDAAARIESGNGGIGFRVPAATITATPGAYRGVENRIGGRMQVWGVDVDLASDPVLDADYRRESFVSTFSCKEDLKLPVEYACMPLEQKLADGAAKLTIQNVGSVVAAFASDTRCGFVSAAVKGAPGIAGAIGRDGGRVTYTIASPCEIDLSTVAVDADCNGLRKGMSGRARLTGSLAIDGRLTGDTSEPVIPSRRDAVAIDFRIEMIGARVQGEESMEVTGVVTGSMHPRLALDSATGACSIETPVVAFENIAWGSGTTATLYTGSSSIAMQIGGSSLDAQSGWTESRENHLSGSIVVGSESFAIPINGAPVLDPSYDRAAYAATWSCLDNLRVPTSDEECSMKQVIGEGIARLIMQNVGTIAGAINRDDACGFSNQDVLMNPRTPPGVGGDAVIGNHGQTGSITWAVEGCRVGSDALEVYEADCTGGATHWQGHAEVDSARTVRGLREEVCFGFLFINVCVESVAPQNDKSVDLSLMNVRLQEFKSYAVPAGGGLPEGVLTIHDGTLEASLQPKTGYSAEQQRYTVPTTESLLQGVHLRNASVTLLTQGKRFDVEIGDSELFAVNGAIDGQENAIAGTLVMDGDVVNVSGTLDPSYNADTMAASFACNVAPEFGCDQTGKSSASVALLFALLLRRASARSRRVGCAR